MFATKNTDKGSVTKRRSNVAMMSPAWDFFPIVIFGLFAAEGTVVGGTMSCSPVDADGASGGGSGGADAAGGGTSF